MTCCQAGETKTHWVFFSTDTFFGGLGCKCKGTKSVKFFWGEDFGNFNHWDSAFPNSRQAPIYNQTCSRLPIDPTSSILGPCPVPLLVLLSHACFTFHRETEGQTIEIIKTLQTPAEYIRLARNIQHFHSCFRARPTAIDCPPHTYLSVHMFVCLYVFICSYVSKTATNIGYWTLMANTSLHHDTKSKKKIFDNKDQSSNHFNNKDKT